MLFEAGEKLSPNTNTLVGGEDVYMHVSRIMFGQIPVFIVNSFV